MAMLNAADEMTSDNLKYQAAICFSFCVLCTITATKISPGAYLVSMAGLAAASAFLFVLTLCRILNSRTAQSGVLPVAVTKERVEQTGMASTTSTMCCSFTPGLPDEHGQYLFWLWDGMVVEGALHRDQELGLVVTHYNLAIPDQPERITHRADTGKVLGWARTNQRNGSLV